MNKPKKHIFVCSSSRPAGTKGFCHSKDSLSIVEAFMEEVNERGLGGDVMVTNTGCLSICEHGPIVVVYPDNIWYGSVSSDDVEEIMDAHIEGGIPLQRLKIS